MQPKLFWTMFRSVKPHDEGMQACCCHARRFANFHDFELLCCNQLIQLGATYADHARGVVYLDAYRIGREQRDHGAAVPSRKLTGSAIQRLTADSRHPAP